MRAVIAVLAGDGIGPEVTAEAVSVLDAVGHRFNHTFVMREGLLGGCAIDVRGTSLPDETLELCHGADAVLLGAVGGPKWDGGKERPERGLLALRKGLQLFANLRPVSLHPSLIDASPLKPSIIEGTDLLVVRELTGGIYFGEKQREADRALDVCTYTVAEVERVVRVACELATQRRGKLTSVDKANVLETSKLWRETTERFVKAHYPKLTLEHILVDAAAMHLLRRPRDFDVVVTENMFGDILTDEASMLAGSIGLLPSASLGATKRGLYEPIHGSAPDIAGRGLANPYGAILSVAMLLRHSLHLEDEARAVEAAVSSTVAAGVLTGDVVAARPGAVAASTSEVGRAVVQALAT